MMHTTTPRRTTLARWKMMLTSACALLPVLLAACSNSAQTGVQLDRNQTFIFPITSAQFVMTQWRTQNDSTPGLTLDPAYIADSYSQQVLNMIQAQLYTFDANMNYIPDAAAGMPTISDGGKTYTIKLKDSLEWSDGQPLTSQDFQAGIEHALDPNLCSIPAKNAPLNPPYSFDINGSPTAACGGMAQFQWAYLQYIQGAGDFASGQGPQHITGIQTPDDKTIVFHLIQPVAFFIGDLTTAAGYPLERSIFKQYGYNFILHYTDGVGQSGPFIIHRWFDPNNGGVSDPQHSTQIEFVPNPHWFGKPVTLRLVEMPLIQNQNDQYDSYTNNKVDYAQVPSHEYPFTQNLQDFHQIQELAIDYFGINRLDPPFDNKLVRQAFALALNKQLLVDSIFQGARTPTNHIIPLGIAGYNTNLLNPPDNSASAALTGNQSLAKSLIQSVANGCLKNFSNDWCPYIIGSNSTGAPPDALASTADVFGATKSCAPYQIGVDKSGKVSLQKQITVVAPKGNGDRIKMAQASAQVWSNFLCLNVNQTIESFGTLLGNVDGNQKKATPEQIWTLAYGADYPDAEDFTTLQFDPTTNLDSARLGYTTPDANDTSKDIVQSMYQADQEQNPTTRIHDYQVIEQKLVNDVAWIPFSQPRYIYRLQTYVRGFQIPADQVVPDQSWPDIFIAAHS